MIYKIGNPLKSGRLLRIEKVFGQTKNKGKRGHISLSLLKLLVLSLFLTSEKKTIRKRANASDPTGPKLIEVHTHTHK